MAPIKKKKTSSRKKPQEKKKPLQLSPEKHPALYADYTNIQVNYTGLKFMFSTVWGLKEDNTPDLRPQITVGVSPEHAAQILTLLADMLEVYQDRYGPIRPIPDHLNLSKEDQKK